MRRSLKSKSGTFLAPRPEVHLEWHRNHKSRPLARVSLLLFSFDTFTNVHAPALRMRKIPSPSVSMLGSQKEGCRNVSKFAFFSDVKITPTLNPGGRGFVGLILARRVAPRAPRARAALGARTVLDRGVFCACIEPTSKKSRAAGCGEGAGCCKKGGD